MVIVKGGRIIVAMAFNTKTSLKLIFFVFLLILLGGELFSRFLLGLGDPALVQTHPTIEYLYLPNQVVHPFGNLFKTNQYGMRSEDFPKMKSDANEIRILVVGDSVVNGGNTTPQRDLATSLLEEQLSNVLHRPVVVANISAGSWGPPNELAYLKTFGTFNADILILELSSEDYGDAPTFAPLNPDTHPTHKPSSALLEGMVKYLPRYLPTFLPKNSDERAPDPTPTDVANCLQAEEEIFKIAKANGIQPILLQHWRKSEIRRGIADAGHTEILAVADRLQVPNYQDREVLNSAKYEEIDSFYKDDIHPSVLGQHALAILLAKIVHNSPPLR